MKPLLDVQSEFFATAPRFIVPEAALVAGACALFVLAAFLPRRAVAVGVGMLTVAGAALAAVLAGPREAFEMAQLAAQTDFPASSLAPFVPGPAAEFVRWLAIVSAGALLLLAWPELRDDFACEFAACLLIVAAGVALVGRANDLLSLFLALEMVSIPTYVLLYLPRRTEEAEEATVKYFLLSILSSGVLLFGFSYLYGVAGSTNLGVIAATLSAPGGVGPLALVGATLAVAGYAFRLAAVPFHFYAPDVYQAGPTSVVAQLAYIPKVAGFVALARTLELLDPADGSTPFSPATPLPALLWMLAALTMTAGNVMALLQGNLKRLFAYSGIAHSGYMLIGVVTAASLPSSPTGQSGMDAVLVYLVAYGLMTVGAFAVLAALGAGGGKFETVSDLDGLADRHPVAALTLAIFLVSLIGLPATAGFTGKFLLFTAALDVPGSGGMGVLLRVLVALAAVNAAVGAAYYLRILGAMYLRSPAEPGRLRGAAMLPMGVAMVCAVGTLLFGVYPQPLSQLARQAAPPVAPLTTAAR